MYRHLCPMILIIGICLAGSTFAASISYTVTFNGQDFEFSKENGYDVVRYPKCLYYGEIGAPQMLIYSCNFIIPRDEVIQSVIINSATAIQFQGKYNMLPRQNDGYYSQCCDSIIPWVEPDSKYYGNNDLYPAIAIMPGGDGYFDGANHIAAVQVMPVSYRALNQDLYYYSSITFTITTGGYPAQTPIFVQSRMRDDQAKYNLILNASVKNPQDVTLYGYTPELSDTSIAQNSDPLFAPLLIVTRDSLRGYWDSYLDWLNRKGKRASVVTMEAIVGWGMVDDPVINDDADLLRGYLKYGYERGVVWVLLGGVSDRMILPNIYSDNVNVPSRYTVKEHYVNGQMARCLSGEDTWVPTDIYFSELQNDWELDGDGYPGEYDAIDPRGPAFGGDGFILDKNQELFVGRLPVLNGQDIYNWTQKILNYEQNPGNGSADYLLNTYWASADRFQYLQEAENNQQGHFNINGFTNHFDGEDDWDSDNPQSPTAPFILDMINQFPAFINFYHHGRFWSGAVRKGRGDGLGPDLSMLESRQRTDCLIDDQQGCHIEEMTNHDKPGFLFSCACAQAGYDCSFDPNDIDSRCIGGAYLLSENGGVGFISTTRFSYVDMSYWGQSYFLDYLAVNSPNEIGPAKVYMDMHYPDHWTQQGVLKNWALLGTPEQEIWTSIPAHFDVSVDYSSNRVTVTSGIWNNPVEGALVCFMSRVSNAYYVATTNTNGIAQVDPDYQLDVTEATDITVTKHNFIPYQIIGSGDIDKNIYWRGDIVFYGNITVPSGKILTIKPGTKIKTVGTELSVYGQLKVEGSSDHYVVMTSANASPIKGDWTGIRIYSGGSLDMAYCDLQYATTGIRADQPTAFSVEHCTIEHNSLAGIDARYLPSTGKVRYSKIEDSGNYGLYFYKNSPQADYDTLLNSRYGIYYSGNESPVFSNCKIAFTATPNNSYWGIQATKPLNGANPSPQAIADTIYGFHQGGISYSYATSSGGIFDCRIISNGPYGIYYSSSAAKVGTQSMQGRTLIRSNTIGMELTNYSSPQVRRTKFLDNINKGVEISSGCSPDFGTALNYGNNSFILNSPGAGVYHMYNRNLALFNAPYNYWSPLNLIYFYNANYSPNLGIDPLPRIVAPPNEAESLPEDLDIATAYPNPFNPSTTISFNLSNSQRVTVSIYNIIGQKVRNLYEGYAKSGMVSLLWDGRDETGQSVATGAYLCSIRTETKHLSLKLTILK